MRQQKPDSSRETYLQGNVELSREVIDTVVERQAGDHAPHLGVGKRRSVSWSSAGSV
jgi:hypothetical protein